MQTQIRRYNVVVKGKVQDVGFRDYVIALANIVKIRGFIFNDTDGSVRMVLEGVKETITNFLNDIKFKDIAGVEIASLQQREITGDFDLPVRFVRLSTDEMYDIDRKLGIGNEYLKDIKHDTSILHDIKHDTSMLPDIKRDISVLPDVKSGIDGLNTKFDSFNLRMDEHNSRLEKILEKLAEK